MGPYRSKFSSLIPSSPINLSLLTQFPPARLSCGACASIHVRQACGGSNRMDVLSSLQDDRRRKGGRRSASRGKREKAGQSSAPSSKEEREGAMSLHLELLTSSGHISPQLTGQRRKTHHIVLVSVFTIYNAPQSSLTLDFNFHQGSFQFCRSTSTSRTQPRIAVRPWSAEILRALFTVSAAFGHTYLWLCKVRCSLRTRRMMPDVDTAAWLRLQRRNPRLAEV